MNLIGLLLKASWRSVAIAAIAGSISGFCNASLITLIGTAVRDSNNNQLLLAFIALTLIALITSLISRFVLAGLSYDAIYRLRLQLSHWILSSPLRHLEELGANKLLATLTEDTLTIAQIVGVIPFLCIDIAVVLGCLGYLCWLSWQGFIVTFGFFLVAIALLQSFIARAHLLLEHAREQQDQLFKHFRAITDGIKELKLNAERRKAFMTKELEATAEKSRQLDTMSIRIFGVTASIGELVLFTLLAIVVFGLPKLVPIEASILSSYVLVLTYASQPIGRLLQLLPGLNRGAVSLQKIETLELSLASRSERSSDLQTLSTFQRIDLVEVSHTYYQDHGEQFTLGPSNLTIHAGELIFITGGNGSGKSTLAKIITGLYIPESGQIECDRQPITSENRECYRQLFATVFSDFYLFDRLLGIPDKELVTQAQHYLKQLQLTHKVQIRGDQLSTIELSQGQRKRLALLTAYLEDRSIYLFDEWAADQDPFFREIFYTQLLPELKQRGKTVIVITHDDRYFHLADRQIKLDYGQFVD